MSKKILVLGTYIDAPYHPLTDVDMRLQKMFPEMELICTDDTTQLLHAANYDGIISYLDIWNSALSDEETISLKEYVENGGTLLLLHNGISIQSQEPLRLMVGGKFLTHPLMEDITFTMKPHPITEDCQEFTLCEEPYQFELVDDEKEIFLEYIYRGERYVAGWSKIVGKGRLVFLTPGHTAEKFDCPEYQKLIQNSLLWCME